LQLLFHFTLLICFFLHLYHFCILKLVAYFRDNRNEFTEADYKIMFSMNGPRRKGMYISAYISVHYFLYKKLAILNNIVSLTFLLYSLLLLLPFVSNFEMKVISICMNNQNPKFDYYLFLAERNLNSKFRNEWLIKKKLSFLFFMLEICRLFPLLKSV
jgi:hypothetical protein